MTWRLVTFISFVLAISHADPEDHSVSRNEFSRTSSRMSTNCVNGKCQVCVNDNCYNSDSGSLAKSMLRDDCPPAFTYAACFFVLIDERCPMGKCQGFGTKEPCNSLSDCGTSATDCKESLCRYAEPAGKEVNSCAFANQCKSDEECVGGICKQGKRRHLTEVHCTFDRDCPASHQCDRATCYEGGKKHQEGVSCVFNHQCLSGYYCDKNVMTCYEGGPEHLQTVCVMNSQCPQGYVCGDMTCTKI